MLQRVRRAAPLLVTMALVGVLVVGCASDDGSTVGTSTTSTYVGRRGAPRVAIAGDSIIELARPSIVAALEDDYRVRIDAFSGRSIAELTPAITEQVATKPAVAVVNLGTNDMLLGNASWRSDLDRMLALVAGVPCVEVVTVYDGRWPPIDANVGTQINARLAAAAAGIIHLIDWNGAVDRDPSFIAADSIHPGAAGQQWIARSLRDAIRADCRPT